MSLFDNLEKTVNVLTAAKTIWLMFKISVSLLKFGYIFFIHRCCSHIARLEHTYFSAGNNQSSLPKVHHEQPVMSIPNLDGSYK